jgi:hypothetical protein
MKLAQEIMRRNSSKCKQSDEIELASCVLNNLANENKIQLFFSRYDEGENFESEKNLIESLSVKNLRKIRKWLYKQCGNCEQKP